MNAGLLSKQLNYLPGGESLRRSVMQSDHQPRGTPALSEGHGHQAAATYIAPHRRRDHISIGAGKGNGYDKICVLLCHLVNCGNRLCRPLAGGL